MASNKLNEGVGKKIVEALKKQSEVEINAISSETEDITNDETIEIPSLEQTFDKSKQEESEDFLASLQTDNLETPTDQKKSENFTEQESAPIQFEQTPQTTFTQSQMNQAMSQAFSNIQQAQNETLVSELDNFEVPNNIAVLKKLITQLPTGVTRHTGAQIIRQTMEALGISMKSVLQEAQQLQEGLNMSAQECQATVQEYKKQIIALEKQAQNHQRQYSALNELISLFIQTK